MDFCRKQVKSDCEQLLRRFHSTDGTLKREKRAFSRLILDTACCYFLPPFSFQIRVGGLYLLYSLFHCQTALPPEQIRLALKDWEDVKKFEKDAVDAQHLDVIFILRKLMLYKTFHFTAMPTLLAFEKKKKFERSPLCEEFMERASRPQELINVELLEELSNVHDLYEKMKTSVSEEANLSVNLIRKGLVPELRSTVMDFYKWQQRKDTYEDEDEGTSSQQECSKRAELVASIKSKAYGVAAEASRSRRHRQLEVDFTSSEAGPAHTSGHSKSGKPSLKARTNETVHIAGDLWKEATTSTQINCLTTLDSVAEKPKKYKKFKW
ncbi:hypothetical protein PAMP_006158 [Pampus punctatissimus]